MVLLGYFNKLGTSGLEQKGGLFESSGLSLLVTFPGNCVRACTEGQDGPLLIMVTPRSRDQLCMQNGGLDICMEVIS